MPLRPFRIFSKIRRDIRSSRFATGVNDTGGKWKNSSIRNFFNNDDTGGKLCTLTCEYLPEFSKKFEMILMLLSGAWGKAIHEKT
jgi:hypothetical protein